LDGVVKFALLNVQLTSVKAKVFWPDIIHFNIVVEIWLKTYDKANIQYKGYGLLLFGGKQDIYANYWKKKITTKSFYWLFLYR
jgi:hypothetical protein